MTNPLTATESIDAGELAIGYADLGERTGEPVVLLHGYPYDIQSFAAVAPLLVDAGFRVIVPYLRGHGSTRFLDENTPRSGQQSALAVDLLAFIEALAIEPPILAGYDWGGRAACIAAAIKPEKVRGLVSVNGYLIQDLATAGTPLRPDLEAGFWYFWYFTTERGRAGLSRNRAEVAEVIWKRNSPEWSFTPEELQRTALSFDNPDYVDVVIHSYRHRLGLAPGNPTLEPIERLLRDRPAISVPAITLDGEADGNFPATDGSASAHLFTGWRQHRQVPHAGHNLPAEAPHALAEAILDVADPPGVGAGTP